MVTQGLRGAGTAQRNAPRPRLQLREAHGKRMKNLIRQGHFLGTKLRSLRKRNGLTLDELSARCVQIDAAGAPSVSYLSMVETGKRMPSADMLDMLAGIFSKDARWFLDENTEVEAAPAQRERGGLEAMPLEPAFLFSHELLQNALPELLSQTGTTGRQFAQLLIRVWQETRHNNFPDIERAAEECGGRQMPLTLYAWRDFECSFFAGALLCPRVPFRRFLIREAHNVAACHKVGVTPALVMRRMTAVSPYRHWHFFDAYAPGYLRAVYRGNGIPLPWGNMSLVSDPCPRWAVFRLLHATPAAPPMQKPKSQISVMQDGKRARLYCCHSLLTRDALDEVHVLSVGVDLLPALDAQGFDGEETVAAVCETRRRGGGDAASSEQTARRAARPHS